MFFLCIQFSFEIAWPLLWYIDLIYNKCIEKYDMLGGTEPLFDGTV